jgi:hypothetical protein
MYNLKGLTKDFEAWGHNANYRKVCCNVNANADVTVIKRIHIKTAFTKDLVV